MCAMVDTTRLWLHLELRLERRRGGAMHCNINHASLVVSAKVTVMSGFDYTAPAELFAAHGRAGLRYRCFSRSAEAIRYAMEKLPAGELSVAAIEVDDQRY
jgi:hypothetical protein